MTCVVRRRSSTRSTALIAPPSLPAGGSTMTRNTFLKQMRYVYQRNRVYHELLTCHIDLWLDIVQRLVVIGSTISAKLFHRSSCVRFSCALRSTTRTSYAVSSFGQIQSFLGRGWAKVGKQFARKFVGVTFVKWQKLFATNWSLWREVDAVRENARSTGWFRRARSIDRNDRPLFPLLFQNRSSLRQEWTNLKRETICLFRKKNEPSLMVFRAAYNRRVDQRRNFLGERRSQVA